jgi:hypothetical protein
MAEVGTDERAVLLFDETVIILLVGSGAGEGDVAGSLGPESEQVGIEELTAVVRMDLADGEGQMVEDMAEGITHDQPGATQDSTTLTPAGSDVDHLEGMDIVTRGGRITEMDQVHLEVVRLGSIPGDTPHGDTLGERSRSGGALAG